MPIAINIRASKNTIMTAGKIIAMMIPAPRARQINPHGINLFGGPRINTPPFLLYYSI